jgi:hypothetical protein
MQDELAALSLESIHQVVVGATHESLLCDKRDSQVTSAAIEQVVDAVRTDRPLIRLTLQQRMLGRSLRQFPKGR